MTSAHYYFVDVHVVSMAMTNGYHDDHTILLATGKADPQREHGSTRTTQRDIGVKCRGTQERNNRV